MAVLGQETLVINSSTLGPISGSAPMYACRAWVNFDGTTAPGTIRANGNVSSVSRTTTGDYTINFTTAMPDGNYSLAGMSVCFSSANVTGASTVTLYPSGSGTYLALTKSTTQTRILVGNPNTGAPVNSGDISCTFFR